MKIIITISILFLLIQYSFSQYAPPVGQLGSTAISKDSSIFRSWATSCILYLGPMDISHPENGLVNTGNSNSAIGKADNNVVSLGDGGIATLTFSFPVINGPGFDFAVFENSFSDDFLELAFVEVSSDGINFVRFPSVSNTPESPQIDGFGVLDAKQIYNLAGKYRAGFGTPFDLEELKGIPNLNINNITHIRIIDVVGNTSSAYGTNDSEGHFINDPWPTPFPASGFDLDAIGVINQTNNAEVQTSFSDNNSIQIYPNPATENCTINSQNKIEKITISDVTGKLISEKITDKNSILIDCLNFSKGMYFVTVKTDKNSIVKKLFKSEN